MKEGAETIYLIWRVVVASSHGQAANELQQQADLQANNV
jgi:hypothetical protein